MLSTDKFPSVTRVISPYADYSDVPADKLAYATERGKNVHAIIAAVALGIWVPDIPEECKGYIESFEGWFESYVEEVYCVEQKFVDLGYRFKGHIDLYARLKRMGRALIDYKTPVSASRAWRVQMAAYERLLQVNKNPMDVVASLQLHPKGKIPKMIRYENTSAQDFNIFLGILNAHHFFGG